MSHLQALRSHRDASAWHTPTLGIPQPQIASTDYIKAWPYRSVRGHQQERSWQMALTALPCSQYNCVEDAAYCISLC